MQSLKNFKLTVEYDGTGFNGWQIQKQGERTVQGEIQLALFQIYKRKISVIASGRTDAGVHALGQVINFKVRTRMTAVEVHRAIMSFLPSDIVVHDALEVSPNFHAQYSAKSKTYRYTILNWHHPSARNRNFCHFYPHAINLRKMRQQAKLLVGKKDFKAFEAADPRKGWHSTIRNVMSIRIVKKNEWIYIDIQADGFLYKMVRNIVGTLMEVGAERSVKTNMKTILHKRDRGAAGETAEPQGLCLMEVLY